MTSPRIATARRVTRSATPVTAEGATIRIPDMPDIGAVTDACSFVGEHLGSGRFSASAVRDYTSKGRGYSIDQFGAVADGVTDIGPIVNTILAKLVAEGGGICLFGPGTYALATPIVIHNSNIRLIGLGRGSFHNVAPHWTPGVTNVVWKGADNGTMITIAPPAGGQRLVGCEVSGMALIAGVYPFTSAAAKGIDIATHGYGTFDVTTFEFKTAHLNFGVVTGMPAGESANCEGNDISIIYRAQSNAGTVLVLGGTTGVGNCALNRIGYIGGQYYHGTVIDWAECDNNTAEMIVNVKAGGGTGTSMVFRGQRTPGGEFGRQNKIEWYSEQTTDGKIIVEGTDTPGVVGPSVENQVVYFDYGNDLPNIFTGTGSSFYYGSNRSPPGKLFENFGYSPPAGVSVDASRVGDAWGIHTAAAPGAFVIDATTMGNSPFIGVQNVQVTPMQNGTTWFVSDVTLTGFTLNVNAAGTFLWRAIII